MGGSRSLETGGAANGLYVHQKCHERIESRRASAQNSGLLLHQTQIPSEVPVKLWYGWHVLKDDGSVVACQRLGEGGEASLTVGVNNFGNVEVTTYGDYVERIPDPVSSGVSTDHSDDRSLADTQLGSDNVGGDSVGFGLVAD
jgi:hypothetical protein